VHKVFLSYSRSSEASAQSIVADLQSLGHEIWFDQELSGGQPWWDRILTAIRECDLLVFTLDSSSLNSLACSREYGYAFALGKPVLPLLVEDGVSKNLLPPELSRIHFVDYRVQDRTSIIRLTRALNSVPPPQPLPVPMPIPPAVPESYLGSLAKQIAMAPALSFEEQSAALIKLKASLRDAATRGDAMSVLARLRTRRDLFAAIAVEIDGLRAESESAQPGKSVDALERQKLLQLAQLNPRSAIIEAWQLVEFAAAELAKCGDLRESFVETSERLTRSQVALFSELHDRRNQAAHDPELAPSFESAIGYIDLALSLRAGVVAAARVAGDT